MMNRLVKQSIPAFIATTTGLIVLLGRLFPGTVIFEYRGQPTELHDILVDWAVILTAFAFLLGTVNVLYVHARRARRLEKGGQYSLLLLVATLASCAIAIVYGPSGHATVMLFDYVINPLGAALASLVVFALALAAFRLLRARRGLGPVLLGWWFILIASIVLLGSTSLVGIPVDTGWIATAREWIIRVPAMAGMRGMLLGVALGTIITALRVLMTVDRPHSET